MSGRAVDGLTLRELMKEMELVYREFADHLRRGFSPRMDEFVRAIDNGRKGGDGELSERSARNSLQPTLESHQYSQEVFQRFQKLLSAIDARLREIANVG